MASGIQNLERLKRKLAALPDVARILIRTKMAEVADDIVAMMKRLAPELQQPTKGRTKGALRTSIGWTWGKAPKGASVVGKVKSSGNDGMTITIYAGDAVAFYARWLEFGTQHMRAQPYFYVSYRANKKSAVRKIRKSLNDAAKKVAAQS